MQPRRSLKSLAGAVGAAMGALAASRPVATASVGSTSALLKTAMLPSVASPTLVYFGSTACRHASESNITAKAVEVAGAVEGLTHKLVNCNRLSMRLCDEHGVDSYPTVRLYVDQSDEHLSATARSVTTPAGATYAFYDYKGPAKGVDVERDAAMLGKWARLRVKQSEAVLRLGTHKAMAEAYALHANATKIVGFFESYTSPEALAFVDAAIEHLAGTDAVGSTPPAAPVAFGMTTAALPKHASPSVAVFYASDDVRGKRNAALRFVPRPRLPQATSNGLDDARGFGDEALGAFFRRARQPLVFDISVPGVLGDALETAGNDGVSDGLTLLVVVDGDECATENRTTELSALAFELSTEGQAHAARQVGDASAASALKRWLGPASSLVGAPKWTMLTQEAQAMAADTPKGVRVLLCPSGICPDSPFARLGIDPSTVQGPTARLVSLVDRSVFAPPPAFQHFEVPGGCVSTEGLREFASWVAGGKLHADLSPEA